MSAAVARASEDWTTDLDHLLLDAVAKAAGLHAGPGVGIALFIAAAGEVHYTSSARRAEVLPVLEAWLAGTARAAREPLERRCIEIGEMAASVTDVALFLFDLGEGGDIAYFTSMEGAREGIEAWVRIEKGRS